MSDTIRYARLGERRNLEELQRRASMIWEEYRVQLLANPDAIELSARLIREKRVRVAEMSGRTTGFSALVPLSADTAELDGLFVDPDAMRQGIGAWLIEDAGRLAREWGLQAIEVTTNPRAEAFYLREGFVVTGRTDTRFGPANRMRLTLN
jgi:GNAT superfamily N-acetyltransferase